MKIACLEIFFLWPSHHCAAIFSIFVQILTMSVAKKSGSVRLAFQLDGWIFGSGIKSSSSEEPVRSACTKPELCDSGLVWGRGGGGRGWPVPASGLYARCRYSRSQGSILFAYNLVSPWRSCFPLTIPKQGSDRQTDSCCSRCNVQAQFCPR